MFQAGTLLKELKKVGIQLITGTPCSMLTSLFDAAADSDDFDFITTANEAEAIALAAGADLGGRRALVVFQNSGLGNAINPLTSLALPFRTPMLILTTWRGEPDSDDEPQHELMGQITPNLFELLGIPCEEVPEKAVDLTGALRRADDHMQKHGTPYALLLKHDILRAASQSASEDRASFVIEELIPPWEDDERWEQDDALSVIQTNTAERDVVLTTTGFTGRALYALEDRENQLYMVGSMGCVASLALGLAKAQPEKRIVAIDGDGALLMHLGALSTIGHQKPTNLIHILLDNGAHDSTGSQPTANVDFASMAQASGYSKVVRLIDLADLEAYLQETWDALTFLHLRTSPRSNRDLPRPHLKPHEVASRLRTWLGD